MIKLSIGIYLYNVFSIILIIDLIYCKYQMNKDKYIIKWMGLDNWFKTKLICELIVAIVYIVYLIKTMVLFFIK